MVALKDSKNIGDTIEKSIARLTEANDLKGVIDVTDFNTPRQTRQWSGSFDNPKLAFRGAQPQATTSWAVLANTSCITLPLNREEQRPTRHTCRVALIVPQMLSIYQAQNQDQTAYGHTSVAICDLKEPSLPSWRTVPRLLRRGR